MIILIYDELRIPGWSNWSLILLNSFNWIIWPAIPMTSTWIEGWIKFKCNE